MHTVTSADGTTIAYDRTGAGDPVVLVAGAFSYRRYPGQVKLAELLSARFTVYNYDRRGRGDSGDTQPYAIEREIEDLAAVIGATGGEAHVWGLSSGAVLALEAAPASRPAPACHRADRGRAARRGGPVFHGGRYGGAVVRPRLAAADAGDLEEAHRGRAHPALRRRPHRALSVRPPAAAGSMGGSDHAHAGDVRRREGESRPAPARLGGRRRCAAG